MVAKTPYNLIGWAPPQWTTIIAGALDPGDAGMLTIQKAYRLSSWPVDTEGPNIPAHAAVGA